MRAADALCLTVMEIVFLEPDDWQRYRDIRMQALRTDPAAFFTTAEESEQFNESDWRRRLDRPDAVTFVVSDSGIDVGLAGILPYSQADATDGEYELVAMWVAPSARRTGASKLLLNTAIDAARQQGARRLVLWVAWGNVRAEALYQQFGFKRTGQTGSFPPPRNTPEFQMALKL